MLSFMRELAPSLVKYKVSWLYGGGGRKFLAPPVPLTRHQRATDKPQSVFLAFRIRKEAGMEDGFWLSQVPQPLLRGICGSLATAPLCQLVRTSKPISGTH